MTMAKSSVDRFRETLEESINCIPDNYFDDLIDESMLSPKETVKYLRLNGLDYISYDLLSRWRQEDRAIRYYKGPLEVFYKKSDLDKFISNPIRDIYIEKIDVPDITSLLIDSILEKTFRRQLEKIK